MKFIAFASGLPGFTLKLINSTRNSQFQTLLLSCFKSSTWTLSKKCKNWKKKSFTSATGWEARKAEVGMINHEHSHHWTTKLIVMDTWTWIFTNWNIFRWKIVESLKVKEATRMICGEICNSLNLPSMKLLKNNAHVSHISEACLLVASLKPFLSHLFLASDGNKLRCVCKLFFWSVRDECYGILILTVAPKPRDQQMHLSRWCAVDYLLIACKNVQKYEMRKKLKLQLLTLICFIALWLSSKILLDLCNLHDE